MASAQDSREALLLQIYGRVQGVSFRAAMRRQAEALGLTGWVRNRSDGSVEALVAGPPAGVERMRRWAQRGPPAAQVDRVQSSPAQLPAADSFEVHPTL